MPMRCCCRTTPAAQRRRDRDRRSRRRADRGRGNRPHDRPGAHVHARDGHGRAADARRRDRDRQAHRGGPEPGPELARAVPVVDPDPARRIRAAPRRQEAHERVPRRLHRRRGAGAACRRSSPKRTRKRKTPTAKTTKPRKPAPARPARIRRSRAPHGPHAQALREVPGARTRSSAPTTSKTLKVRQNMGEEFLKLKLPAIMIDGMVKQAARRGEHDPHARAQHHGHRAAGTGSMPRKDFLKALPGQRDEPALGRQRRRARRPSTRPR